MERRDFLKVSGWTGGGLAVLGLRWGRRVYARNQLETELREKADLILTQKSLSELRELPLSARESIRTWFHGPCLNAAEFARTVSSNAFREQVARCASADESEMLFLSEFLRHVVSETEILNRVVLIAEEIGDELDLNWAECCRDLSEQWDVGIRAYGSTLPIDFASDLEPTIRSSVAECLALARAGGQRPALSETTEKIGQSAILLLPLAPIPNLAIPLFVLVAAGHLYHYYASLQNNSSDRIQRAVSSRLSLLGNRIGAEFEAEVRTAIGRLHEWQHRAVTQAATRHATATV